MNWRSPSIIFTIFSIIGGLLLAGALYSWYDTKSFNATATKTTGTVIEMVPHSGSSGSHDTYAPVIRYVDASGTMHEYRSSTASYPPAYAVGDVTDLYYDPQHPDHAKVSGWMEYFGVTILGGIGLVFSLIGWIGYFVARPQSHKLKNTGQLVKADIIDVKQNKLLAVNHRHPYIIHCRWKDSLTGEERYFKSEMIMENPSSALNGTKQLDVYIDPRRPQRYYVDITFLSGWRAR